MHIKKISFFLILFFGIAFAFIIHAGETRKNLGEQLDADNLKVIQYLKKLPLSAQGKKITGVTLSDGTNELKDMTYLGKIKTPQKEKHIYLFSNGVRKLAYEWVDLGGKALSLPECRGEEFEDGGARVLSGDVYTWKAVQPGEGVVINLCPASSH